MASDQDNALAYAPVENPDEVDAYFGEVADYVNAGLAKCGFGLDASEVMARNPAWRMSAPSWVRVFHECLEQPDRSNLVRAAVAFDFRHVGGGLEIVAPLVAALRGARDHPNFIARLARTATDQRPPLGFRGHFRLDGRGDAGVLDLKKGGASPVASLARFHALANGVTISSTTDRLQAVEELQALPGETAAALREAFIIITRVRLEHHAARIRAGLTPDNLIHPSHLTPLARSGLREAFRVIAAAQKQLNRYVPLGL
jgi:CBS domain-containing protein